ncbi:uncharacterized protein ALTATR162_LOCUS2208 [Alternaria atra]|uniref:Polynucleotide 5'-hydroxyl-kinase GRC3 n=1 Tax=Alternaria atra TaxID=119953 RepID=A0A8J2MX35_9PLEO|nr:uncharacterized protein ALTATR162_LOCUS2208 [Alternaria atra]CAG5148499.1 unnamed protein product [Alternaria atra]
MSGKRKRAEDTAAAGVASGKPLTAIAAARLRTEAAAKVVNTPEVTLEQIPVPASPLLQDGKSGQEDSDEEEQRVPVQRNLKLCNWRNEPQNILSDTDAELTINLNKHATITLVGCFDLVVLRGAVNINGANIGTVSRDGQKNQVHRASVPVTHPISKIRGLDGTNHIRFKTCKIPAPLAHISPVFDGIWNDVNDRSFRIVTNSDADTLSRPLRPEVTPEDWLRAIEDCASNPSITVVTGTPSSGKSTFARRLVNRSLTGLGKTAPSVPAVCWMDLDPQKQEYVPGGQVSLVVVRDLNLGPSFTRPSVVPEQRETTRNEVIRAHPVPTNFANYADYYQSCVEDLFLAYRNLSSRDPSLPLVVDIPSFLYSSHFDLLNKLLARIKPHNVVHLSDTRAIDTETAARLHLLQTSTSQYHGTVYEITAQQPQSIPVRSENELSAMQMQSYFHLKSSSTSQGQPQVLSWTLDPLSQLVPWEFCYEETLEREQDVVAFAMYSEPVEPSSLLHALNGSIVQIIQSTSSAVPTSDGSLPRTQKLGIPYLPESERTGMVQPLDPRTTRLVCTAMIRGFNPEKKIVEVLVPKTHESLLYNLSPERTIFVGGCCDVPEWAFLEDACAQEEAVKAKTTVGDVPVWVEKEDVVDGMGYLSTVRRVRKFQT